MSWRISWKPLSWVQVYPCSYEILGNVRGLVSPACHHYNDVIMSAMACEITSITIVYSTIYSDTDQRKNPSSASLAFVRGIHRWPVNSPHKGPVTRKIFLFADVIMQKFVTVGAKCDIVYFGPRIKLIWFAKDGFSHRAHILMLFSLISRGYSVLRDKYACILLIPLSLLQLR